MRTPYLTDSDPRGEFSRCGLTADPSARAEALGRDDNSEFTRAFS